MTVLKGRYLSLNKFGNPSTDKIISLESEDINGDSVKGDDVLVRIKYACINPSDLFTMMGIYPGARCVREATLPARIGFEASGTVEAVGEGVSGLAVGEHVVVLVGSETGTYADYIKVPRSKVVSVPSAIPLEHAAQLFINPVSILGMLAELGIGQGEYLVQTAANSALGRMMIQVCRLRNIKTVNIVRRESLRAELMELGADHVIVSQEDGANIVQELKELARSLSIRGFKYMIDAVGGTTGNQLIESLSENGMLLIYGLQGGTSCTINAANLLFKTATVKGFWLVPWFAKQPAQRQNELLQEILSLMQKGIVNPQVERTFSLADFENAFREEAKSSKGGRVGKLLFSMEQQQ